MAPRQGSTAESPAAEDELDVTAPETATEDSAAHPATADAEVATSPEPTDTPTASPADAEEPQATDDPAPKPKPEARKPSPVDQAIAHLTKAPEATDAAQNPAAKPTDRATPTPKDAAAKDAPPAPADGSPSEKKDDALADWSPEERKHTKGKVKERFRQQHDQIKELAPHAEVGRGWGQFVHEHGLGQDLNALPDEGMVVAVRTQAAALRVSQAAREKRGAADGDVRLLRANREAIDRVLALAGHAPPAAPVEDDSKVEVSAEVRDLKDAFGVVKDEDELRVVQAALNRYRGRKAEAARKPAGGEPAPAQSRAAPAPAAPAPSVPWTPEDEALAKAAMAEDIVGAGVARERVAAHYTTNLVPLVAKRVQGLYPGKNPDEVWLRLSPSNRRELVRQAQSTWQAGQPKPPPSPARPTAPKPPPVQGTGARPALSRAGAPGKGAVAAAIARMSGEEAE